ncbi:MAG TPA: DUF2252 domain-containing protein [Gemmataceae bacterium]|nr:DUF2252 domain-containing protein [Gemmataceae bacterium]
MGKNSESAADDRDESVDAPSRREALRSRGRSLRSDCPRSSHGNVVLGQASRDPLGLLEQSNAGRVEHLLPVRYSRMLESPFAFFRGTAVLQAYDLKGTPSAGVIVQCCGDCHVMNFGGFASPERSLVFDITDFDETFPAPFEWDVKRLAVSFVLAARWLGFDDPSAWHIVECVVGAYRAFMGQFAQMKALEVWYAQITEEDVVRHFADDPKALRYLRQRVEKAMKSTSEVVFHKLTHVVNGRPRIVDQQPLLYHVDPSVVDLERDAVPFFEGYRKNLPPAHQNLLDRFELVDLAFKVVGVGSVGTHCFVTLWMADNDDPLFLQVKEARPSVLEGLAGPASWQNNGERVVTGQRLMQSASDIFLGWSESRQGEYAYVRQLRDHKVAQELTGMSRGLLASTGELCGRALARAHAKSGRAAAIDGYLGSGTNFDTAIAAYALAYVDQVEEDYAEFQAAVNAGRFPVESMPSGLEAAIR